MWEDAQKCDAGKCRDEGHGDSRTAEKEEKSGGRTQQLGEIDEKVLVMRVEAMLGEVRRIGVI